MKTLFLVVLIVLVVVVLSPGVSMAADPCKPGEGCGQEKDMSKVKVSWVPHKGTGEKVQVVNAQTSSPAMSKAYGQIKDCLKELPCTVAGSVQEIYLVQGEGALTSRGMDKNLGDIAVSAGGKPEEYGYALPGGVMVLDYLQVASTLKRSCVHESSHLHHYSIDENGTFSSAGFKPDTSGLTKRNDFVTQVATGKTNFSKQWLDAVNATGSWKGYDWYKQHIWDDPDQYGWMTPWAGFARGYSATSLPEDVVTTAEDLMSGCKGVKSIADLDPANDPTAQNIADPIKQAQQARNRMGEKLKLLLDNGFICKDQIDKCGVELICDASGCRVVPALDCASYTDAISKTSTASGLTPDQVNAEKNKVGGTLGGLLQSGAVTKDQLKQKCGIETTEEVLFFSTMGGPMSCCEEGWWQKQEYCGTNPAKMAGYTFSVGAGCVDTFRNGS